MTTYKDIGVEKHGHVGLIEIRKPPLNFFDVELINQIADALEEFDADIEIRASVLAAQGKASAPAPISAIRSGRSRKERAKVDPASNLPINHLYVQAVRIFRNKKADRRRHPWRGHRRWPGACDLGRFPRRLPRKRALRPISPSSASTRASD